MLPTITSSRPLAGLRYSAPAGREDGSTAAPRSLTTGDPAATASPGAATGGAATGAAPRGAEDAATPAPCACPVPAPHPVSNTLAAMTGPIRRARVEACNIRGLLACSSVV